MRELTYLQALAEAGAEEMRRDERVFVMGEDIETGLFGATAGFIDEFGPERVRNTPISEVGFVGAAVGAAMTGLRPIVDMSISVFLYVAMDQVVSQAAKDTYLFGGQARIPLVIRSALFYGGSNAAHHSDRPYPMFMNVPGLKIITPSTPYDAKGLLKAAIREDDPVLCFEDSTLWYSRGPVPEEEYVVPLGKADVKREGNDLTIVAVAGSVPHALAAAKQLEDQGVSAEVIDPRTLVPLDWDTILASVAKTGYLVVADPAHTTCSAASEIAAIVAEHGFADLRGAIVRVTTPDVQIPFSPALERPLYPNAKKIVAAAHKAMGAPLTSAASER
jgi:pyruvate dehydrogenase E1 component beta subunit